MDTDTHHRTIVDALIAYSDGDPEPLRAGGVHAANVTVVGYQADLEQAFDEVCAMIRLINRPQSGWQLIKTVHDVYEARESGKVGLIMGWQNAKPLETQLDRIDGFYALGVRVLQLTYNEANVLGDGCGEKRGGGLTAFGLSAVKRMNEVGMAIDLSHCSEQTILDACAVSTKPVLLTHANAQAIQPRVRNKSDVALRAVAATGGIIGISVHGFLNWDGNPSHPPTLVDVARHARHVANLVGIEHLALGTDLVCVQSTQTVQKVLNSTAKANSGEVAEYVAAFGNELAGRYPQEASSPREFTNILEALKDAAFTEREIDAIAGGNLIAALRQIWV